MRLSRGLPIVLFFPCFFLSSVAAEGRALHPRIALHRKPNFTASEAVPNVCPTPGQASYDPNYDGLPCSQYTVTDATNIFPGPHVYVVIGQGGFRGISGASFGIEYNTDLTLGIANAHIAWTSCADGLEFPYDGGFGAFPKPLGSLRMTWGTCQDQVIGDDGVHAVAGALYVYAYSEDVLKITPNNNITEGWGEELPPELSVADCEGHETNLFPPAHQGGKRPPPTVQAGIGGFEGHPRDRCTFSGGSAQGMTPRLLQFAEGTDGPMLGAPQGATTEETRGHRDRILENDSENRRFSKRVLGIQGKD